MNFDKIRKKIFFGIYKVVPYNLINFFLRKILYLLIFISKKNFNYSNSNKKIVSMVCHRDVGAYLLVVKTLCFFSKSNNNFFAINDGSLTNFDKKYLSLHNNITVIDLPDNYIENLEYKFNLNWTTIKYIGIKKIFPNQKIWYMDCDIIFYKNPRDFLENNSIVFMNDVSSAYAFSKLEIEGLLHVKLIPKVNTGLFCINTSLIDDGIVRELNEMEKKIRKYRFMLYHHFEQTAYMVLFSKLKKKNIVLKRLGNDYFLLPKSGSKLINQQKNIVCIHYTGLNVGQWINDGIKIIIKNKLFY